VNVLLVPAHPGFPGQIPQSRKTVVVVVVVVVLQPFNGLFSRTTWVSWHQKGKPFWILMKQEMMGWQCHQLDHMQIICTMLVPHHSVFTGRMPFLPPNQQRQSTEGLSTEGTQNKLHKYFMLL